MFLKSDLRFIFVETEQSCDQGKPCMGSSLYIFHSILALHIYIFSFLILCSNNEILQSLAFAENAISELIIQLVMQEL
jgi:hypothetical protein